MELTRKEYLDLLKVCNVLTFDRSDPHHVISIRIKDGKETTRIEEIDSCKGYYFGRRDIAMVNLQDAKGRIKEQLMVYPTEDGQTSRGEAWKFMSKGQKAEAIRINQAIIESGKEHPGMLRLIYQGI